MKFIASNIMINNMNKYLVEFFGTFMLVLTIALSGGNAFAIGLVLIALVYMGGNISGAHYNPAVTLAVNLRGKIDVDTAGKYIIFQILGALLGALASNLIKGSVFTPAPITGVSAISVFLVELIFTCGLAFTVLHVATSSKSKNNQYYGLAIGSILAASIFAGGPISGGVYNPAVVVGTMVANLANLTSNFSNLIIYLVAQFAGGALASLIFRKTAPDLK